MKTIVNKTKHDIKMSTGGGVRVIKPSEVNVEMTEFKDSFIVNDMEVVKSSYTSNLPPISDSILYIVPAFVRQKLDRVDLLSPDMRGAKRNKYNQIISVRNFIQSN